MLLNILTAPLYGQNMALSDAEYSELVSYAEQGKIQAIVGLAEYYRLNSMNDEARKWYDKAIELGDIGAGFAYYDQTCKEKYCPRAYDGGAKLSHRKSDDVAQSYLLKSVELGYAEAQTEYAKQFINKCIYNEKRDELRKKINHLRQGSLYDFPETRKEKRNSYIQSMKEFEDDALRTREEAKEAAKWFRKAAEQGFIPAQMELGNMYAHGHGVEKDATEAANWFARAAEKGDANAQFNLALCYYSGFGVEKDLKKAFKLMTAAANAKGRSALKDLSYFYLHGIGVEKSPSKALEIDEIRPESFAEPEPDYVNESGPPLQKEFYDEFLAGEMKYTTTSERYPIIALLMKRRAQIAAQEYEAQQLQRDAEQARKRDAFISLTQKIVEMGNQRREEERRQRIDNNLQQSVELQRRLQQQLEDHEIDRRMQRKTFPW